MQTIYKHQDGVTPNAKQVLSFLGSNEDQAVLDALQSKKISNLKQIALEDKLRKAELEHQLMKHMKN